MKYIGTFLATHLKLVVLMLWLSLICPALIMAEAARIVYPANNSVIAASTTSIAGKTGGKQHLYISVENSSGKKKYELNLFDNSFSIEVDLKEGLNSVILLSEDETFSMVNIMRGELNPDVDLPADFSPYYLHSKGSLTEKCDQCHEVTKANTVTFLALKDTQTCMTSSCHADYDKGDFVHGPLKKKGSCITCHNPHGSGNRDFLKLSGGKLCFSCHTSAENMLMDAKYVHFPVKKGECLSCHDPHKSDLEYHLKRGSISELCAGCHGKDKISQPVLHAPLKTGDCTACHTPHISENKALLVETDNRLCVRCHKVREEEFNSLYVHEPVKKNCALCHDPHGSATIYHLKNRKDDDGHYVEVEQPITELCLECHRKLDPETVDLIENSKVTHKPVKEGNCIACHSPHSTNFKKQLKASVNDICFSCHEEMKELITSSLFIHGPIKKNGCTQCHMAHGSEEKNLLVTQFSEKYVNPFNMDSYALCFNCHSKEMVLEKQSKQTEFRNGRKNLHYAHVNRKVKGRSCKACHDVHASNQEKRIRDDFTFENKFTVTIEYTKTDTGGGCVVGCHKPKRYDRKKPINNK